MGLQAAAEPTAPVAQPAVQPAPVAHVTAPAAAPAPSGSVAELAGNLAADSQLAPAIGYMDAVLKDAGVDVERALGAAAEHLDATRLDVHYLRDKLGDKADQVIALATSTIGYVAAYQSESIKQVHATAGSEAGFKVAVQAFNAKADPTERAMMSELLNSGDRTKMVYAAQKIAAYGVQAGVVTVHNPAPLGQAGAMQGLSREDYVKAISARNLTDAQYAQFREQRKLGMQQGL